MNLPDLNISRNHTLLKYALINKNISKKIILKILPPLLRPVNRGRAWSLYEGDL